MMHAALLQPYHYYRFAIYYYIWHIMWKDTSNILWKEQTAKVYSIFVIKFFPNQMTDAARIFNNIKAEYFDVQQRIFLQIIQDTL